MSGVLKGLVESAIREKHEELTALKRELDNINENITRVVREIKEIQNEYLLVKTQLPADSNEKFESEKKKDLQEHLKLEQLNVVAKLKNHEGRHDFHILRGARAEMFEKICEMTGPFKASKFYKITKKYYKDMGQKSMESYTRGYMNYFIEKDIISKVSRSKYVKTKKTIEMTPEEARRRIEEERKLMQEVMDK